jgi:copper chaperone CopZ
MIRRQFIKLVALSGAVAAPLEALAGTDHTTMTYQVKGFSCITCAVGLDTLLGKERGVLSSQSTYPEGKVTVSFKPTTCSDEHLRKCIGEMGFTIFSSHAA